MWILIEIVESLRRGRGCVNFDGKIGSYDRVDKGKLCTDLVGRLLKMV